MKLMKSLFIALLFTITAPALFAGEKEAAILDIEVDDALRKFKNEVTGGEQFLAKAKGVLIFPKVYKAGLGIGGEYGKGALRVNGNTVGYYNTAAGSFGFQAGAQRKTIVIAFLTDHSLEKFRYSKGWDIGADASVAVAQYGAAENINTKEFNQPIVAFIFDNKGLMYNLTLEGSKITPIDP